ncbi:uncharacterized protein DNG_07309 [Cephalotrichum gorgonifer]|uniref:F-box domain-containing protein n=1 Tax=Cephalotrichum gorgonifer TaxID=2041049 RepID=A0AAE8N342_9PEZI|nr:uncharacterized protein DNG_07309 [Cephalotrichum gorgonifer]
MEADQPCSRGISSLPLELILRIICFIDPFANPTAVVNFACTAKRFANKLSSILARHKAAHEKYGVISDLHPSVIPVLVRSALGYSDPIDAWHVRSFEVWGTRRSWDEWRTFNLEEEGQNTVQGGEPPIAWTFENGEDRQLIDAFRDQMPERDQRLAQEELQRGGDGFLKMALICHLPRLADIKVTRGEHGLNSFVVWLVKALAWFRESERWPPGLAGLRDVAIGVRSGTWRDKVWDECSPYTLAAMLRLPRLRSLYLNDVDLPQDENGNYFDEDILPPTSTVSRLFLDNVMGMTSDFQNDLVQTPRSLEAFGVRVLPGYEITHVDTMVSRLNKTQGDTIQHLMFYNLGRLSAYR